jgi:hypothetical protein
MILRSSQLTQIAKDVKTRKFIVELMCCGEKPKV